jgi:hypothetical protein
MPLGVETSTKRKLDLPAVATSLANGNSTVDHTLVEGLEKIGSASVHRIAGGVSHTADIGDSTSGKEV